MKKILFAVAVMMAAISVQAQIPAEVTEVVSKCQKVMENPAGVEYNMDMKTAMGPVNLFKAQVVSGYKDGINRTTVKTKVVGKEVLMETGFDGQQEWSIQRIDKKDSIIISPATERKKNDSEIDFDFDFDKIYKKAKMKTKDDYYEIEYYEPKSKKNADASSVTLKISRKNYALRTMSFSFKGMKMSMTINKIKVGLNDDYFKLDLSKYPNAVIIRN